MITYTWDIATLTIKTFNGIDNVVCGVNWSKTGTDEDGNQASYGVATVFSDRVIDVNSNRFISYEDLTQEKIIEWIESKVDQKMVNEHIANEIYKRKINFRHIPAYELPWNIDNPDFPNYRKLDSGGFTINSDDPYGFTLTKFNEKTKQFESIEESQPNS